ncbi:hypothetical protein [Heyndrickxia sporothermodurans]|uniref:hypothetical protein n=1 Tax=Heyndrickxia sporothermodurans TaxID=46224 RepID=UPI000D367A86|nr:hypothetical protein [Heyndrickxia sporothermodurans]PTY93081.1 hypothetical protein B5V90_03075 [Heyndrickxia sporothermodurans]
MNLVEKHTQVDADKKKKRLEEQQRNSRRSGVFGLGSEVQAFMTGPNGEEIPLGTLQSISMESRESAPVFEIGTRDPRSFAGNREFTATLSNVEINRDALANLLGVSREALDRLSE